MIFDKRFTLYQAMDTLKVYCVLKEHSSYHVGMNLNDESHVMLSMGENSAWNDGGPWSSVQCDFSTLERIQAVRGFECPLTLVDTISKIPAHRLIQARVYNHTGLNTTHGEIRNFVIRELGNHADSNTSNVPT